MKWLSPFKYAFAGIRSCFVSELNFRMHSLFAFIALLLSYVLTISAIEWIAVCFCIAFVVTIEILNTAVEKLCDIVHKEMHPGIKKVKDMAAGAVLVAAIFSVITGAVIFLPKLYHFIYTV